MTPESEGQLNVYFRVRVAQRTAASADAVSSSTRQLRLLGHLFHHQGGNHHEHWTIAHPSHEQ
jgi:hypothetical protein